MTKTISTLAALFLATSALTSAAEAGGIRLSFGGPLGSFTAHPKLSDGPGGTARASRHCDKPSYASRARAYSVARNHDDDAPARKAVRKAPKAEVAEAQTRKPKVYIEKNETKPEVKTAKLEDKSVASDAAPTITVPQSPAVQPQLTGTQSTPSAAPAAKTETASLETAPVTAPAVAPDAEPKTAAATEVPAAEPATTEPAKTETKSEKSAKDSKGKTESMANRICKRFSAAIAGLIDVPCE